MVKTRLISSLDKCFFDGKIEDFARVSRIRMLRNQQLSLQLAISDEQTESGPHRILANIRIGGALAPFVRIRSVTSVPVLMPKWPELDDPEYLRDQPGLYPDLLEDLRSNNRVNIIRNQLCALWLDIDPRGQAEPGDYDLTAELLAGAEVIAAEVVHIRILNAALPEQTFHFTQWFYCDCIANYYHVPAFSQRHWEIIENFVRTATRNGVDMLLTPLFTPPLDTHAGGERLTVQLVDVICRTSGNRGQAKYTFGYQRLDRWLDMCNRCGVRYFEISHFFTQWGAAHAPKIMATVDGEYRRLFGWDTDATGEEYPVFLRRFLKSFLAHMKKRGMDQRCVFHISDEPSEKHMEQYRKSAAVISGLLKDYPCMDAMSDYEFYRSGAVKTPVVATCYIQPFIDKKVENLWAYYCCGGFRGVSNRFIAMPGARTRAIGAQFFKYDIAGFLHWGYNFYNNQGSYDAINPYTSTTGDMCCPSGDTFSVYPGMDGTALESMRLLQFREALDDLRAFRLCAELYGKETVISELEKICGEIRFDNTPADTATVMTMRQRVGEMIEAKCGGNVQSEPARGLVF